MANTSTIVDNFDDNSINTGIWSANYGTPSETGGRARITCDTGYSAYATGNSYTWDDTYAQLFPPALASATVECYQTMLLYSALQPGGTDVGFYIDQTAGVFYCVSRTGYFDGTASPITYSGTTHAWMRILKSTTNILFQTAPDGTTWTTRRTLAAPAWLTAATDLQLFFECHRNNGTNNFGEVDNVSTLGVAGSATRAPIVVPSRAVAVKGASTLIRPVPDIVTPVNIPGPKQLVVTPKVIPVKSASTLIRPVPDIVTPLSTKAARILVVTAAEAVRRARAILARPVPYIAPPAPVIPDPTYALYVDWNDDGDFVDTGENVTARALDQRTPVSTRVGRDQARALSPTAAGTAAYELNNISRDYSPENAGSPLAGLVQPGRRTLFTMFYDSTTYVLYNGFLDNFSIKPEYGQRSADVTCLDALGQLNGVKVSTSMYTGIRTGTAVGYVLDAAGWPAALRDLDPGATIMPWWWLDEADAWQALQELADSEGPASLLSVDGDGKIVFRDRHHRLLTAASQTVQATWRSSGTEPTVSAPATYNHGWKEIVNDISFSVPVRTPAAGLSVVWTAPGRITIATGQTVQVTARSTDGFFGAVVPVAGTDYTAVAGSVLVVMGKTSGGSTTVSLTASGGAAIVDNLQVRAIALTTAATLVVHGEDPVSIEAFRRRSLPDIRQPVWASQYDASDIIDLILGRRAQRLPTITVSMVGGDVTRVLQQVSRDLGDRVHVIEEHTGLDADCWIEQISHTVTQGGAEHRTAFGLEKAPEVISNPFTFDVAGQGFDDGVFVGTGYDDPSLMFMFDVTGQGFDDGVFVH